MSSYTFGGATTDAVGIDALVTMAADNRQHLVTGWYRPTTLTAGRYLFSLGTGNSGALIGTPTDELILRANRGTTSSEYTTTGVDLTLDEWRFVAVLSAHENTGTLDAWRVWAGGIETPPVECAVSSSVGGAGNLTNSSTALTVGNRSGGSVAFRGEIADVRWVVTSAATGTTVHPFLTQTSGVIADDEAAYVLQRFVLPAWECRSWDLQRGRNLVIQMGWWPGYQDSPWFRTGTASVADPTAAPTYTGVTVSALGPPRRTLQHPFRPDFAAVG